MSNRVRFSGSRYLQLSADSSSRLLLPNLKHRPSYSPLYAPLSSTPTPRNSPQSRTSSSTRSIPTRLPLKTSSLSSLFATVNPYMNKRLPTVSPMPFSSSAPPQDNLHQTLRRVSSSSSVCLLPPSPSRTSFHRPSTSIRLQISRGSSLERCSRCFGETRTGGAGGGGKKSGLVLAFDAATERRRGLGNEQGRW